MIEALVITAIFAAALVIRHRRIAARKKHLVWCPILEDWIDGRGEWK
jgi:hypothetical protein